MSTIKSGNSDNEKFLSLLKKQIESNLKSLRPVEPLDMMAKHNQFELSDFTQTEAFENELENVGFHVKKIIHNASTAILYEEALQHEKGSFITSSGALNVSSGAKTGRCPSDKRVVDTEETKDIWWGKVNIKLPEESFLANRSRAIDYLNTRERVFVVDAFAGWDKNYRIAIRIITSRAYHALYMQDMLVMPNKEELKNFKPEFVIYNGGQFPANLHTKGMTSSTSVCINFNRNEMVILGTEYAGEMKKGILTLMMFAMPRKGQLCLHSSATLGKEGDVTIFFGLSGTGKTTLSADPNRFLIGDDEHVWTDTGVFNVEGGCYAKVIDISQESEPEIFGAIRFGSVLENVCFDADTRVVDYKDTSLTENTRCAYPLNFIPNALIPAIVDKHPNAIVLLCCDAFGIIPPVSLLTPEQVQYYFISGYTAKVAGTEQGITEPTATFSSCFGAPFLVWHPIVYAELLAKKLKVHQAQAYLLNTGWIGGKYGVGKRCPLKYTRKLVDNINSGALRKAETQTMGVFNLKVPKVVDGVPSEILYPKSSWSNTVEYDETVKKLASLFQKNFKEYEAKVPKEVIAAGPVLV